MYAATAVLPSRYAAPTTEMEGLLGISRYWERHGKPGKGREELAGVSQWFTEGFDTEGLQEARMLLEENN